MAIRLSENYFVNDVLAHFFVYDVLALNSYVNVLKAISRQWDMAFLYWRVDLMRHKLLFKSHQVRQIPLLMPRVVAIVHSKTET